MVIGALPPGFIFGLGLRLPFAITLVTGLVVRYVFAVCHHRHNQGIRLCFAVVYAEPPGCFAIRSPWRTRARLMGLVVGNSTLVLLPFVALLLMMGSMRTVKLLPNSPRYAGRLAIVRAFDPTRDVLTVEVETMRKGMTRPCVFELATEFTDYRSGNAGLADSEGKYNY